MKKIIIISVLLVFLFHCSQAIYAQQTGTRPKVGLVLSGGGSHGMAHVGVLKVMEEAGLRPDYITGVSMGSIVGGMYAIGYSADSLHSILKDVNWNLSLSNNIEENKVIYPEKEHFNNSIISLPVSSKKVRLPSGLISGQQIENLFSYYAWPATGINDFSKLPIPFMCLAVDILTGKIVELRNGYLPDALRASSAVPTFFMPIKIDSALLIDGGVLRNFAAEEVINMGADIVIGSYTGFQTYTEEELKSMPGIIKQLVFQRSLEDYLVQKKFTDILIEPKIKEFPSTIFSNVDSLVSRGYEAALPYKENFRKLADSLNKIGPQKPIENILDNQVFAFDKVEITGNKLYSDYQILGILGIAPGDKINKDLIREKIELLYGKTWFEKVKYSINSRNDSLILLIDCIEAPKSMLYGGVYYDNYIRAGLVFRMTSNDLVTKRSYFDFDAFVGQFYRFRLTMIQYIDRNQRFGLSAGLYTDNNLLPMISIKGESGRTYYRNNYASAAVSEYIGLNQMINLSLNLENNLFIPDYINEDQLKKISYRSLTESFTYKINTIDTKHFPNKGTLFQISFNTSGLLSGKIQTDSDSRTYTSESPGDFLFKRSYSAAGNLRQYFSPGKKLTIEAGGDILFTYTTDSITSPHNYYFAGGVDGLFSRSIPLTGFHTGEIPVEQYAAIRFNSDFEFYENLHLSLMTNIALAREPLQGKDLTILGGYGLGLGYMSIIGPMKIGFIHGFSSIERYISSVKWYISIGFTF